MALSDWARGMGELLRFGARQVAWSVRALVALELFLVASLTVLLPQSAVLLCGFFPATIWFPDAAPWYVPVLAALTGAALVEGLLLFLPAGPAARRARAAVLARVARLRQRRPLAGAFVAYGVAWFPFATAMVPYVAVLLAVRRWTGFDGWRWFGGGIAGIGVGLFLGLLAWALPLGNVRPRLFRIPVLGPMLVEMQLAFAGSAMMVLLPREAAAHRRRILEAAGREA